MDVKYKYVIEMPPAVDSSESYLNKLMTKHTTNIFNGHEFVMISPVLRDGKNEFMHLILDFDCHDMSVGKAFSEATDIANRLSKYDPYFEITPNGVHVVFNIALKMETYRTMAFKKLFSSMPYTKLDFLSSLRDVPIFRIGSWRKPVTILPASELNAKVRSENKHRGGPLHYFDEDGWFKLWKTKLLPTEIISGDAFFVYMKNMFKL